MDAKKHSELLAELVAFTRPIADVQHDLSQFPWDPEREVILRHRDVAGVLERYLGGSVTEEDVEKWAETMEVRDDVTFEDVQPDVLADAIYFLANPLVEGSLTRAKATKWIERLTTRSDPSP